MTPDYSPAPDTVIAQVVCILIDRFQTGLERSNDDWPMRCSPSVSMPKSRQAGAGQCCPVSVARCTSFMPLLVQYFTWRDDPMERTVLAFLDPQDAIRAGSQRAARPAGEVI